MGGGIKAKARLVVRGFEDLELENLKTASPCCSRVGWRMVVSICASMGWIPGKLDVKTAFLRSDGLLREVHVKPPSEAKEGEGWVMATQKSWLWFGRCTERVVSNGEKIFDFIGSGSSCFGGKSVCVEEEWKYLGNRGIACG